MKKTRMGKWAAILAGGLLAACIFLMTPVMGLAYTQAVGIVSADVANVRKEPTTQSDAVTGLVKGSTVTITDEVTDSGGSTWYKVTVDGNAGYIRSDLLIKGTASAGTGTGVQQTGTSGTKPAPTVATPIAETAAYINYESARIRQGASTNHDIAGSAPKNTPVTITGEAKGADGKLWYEIRYTTSGGNEVTGFIRSDLLTIGDPPAAEAPAEETQAPAEGEEALEETGDGENAEAPAEGEETEAPPEEGEQGEETIPPEEETKPDYEMVYRQNDKTGEMEWYLYDNIQGTMQTLNGLLTAAETGVQLSAEKGKLSVERIILIVLAVVAVALAITVTLLLFKIRDLYEDGYDDEEDEDEDEEDDGNEDEDEEDDEEDEEPVVRRKKKGKASASSGRRRKAVYEPEDDEEDEEDDEDGEDEEEVKRPVRPAPKSRKPRNFLADDDEFEFEFLNMDDRE